jgi:hypothetical protein
MVRVMVNTGTMSKLEAVCIPGFEGHRFAPAGERWFPAGLAEPLRKGVLSAFLAHPLSASPAAGQLKAAIESADLSGLGSLTPGQALNRLEYAQLGLRFTTTLGPADLGFQYFYGNLFRPSYSLRGIDAFLAAGMTDLALLDPRIEYNRYHQLGVDWAQVIAGFNIRAELAGHITEDLSGDSGWIRNPFMAWSLGFDRELLGITLNFQCGETVRLFKDRNGNPAVNFEADSPPSATRLILILSKTFLRDNLELKCTGIFDPEDKGLYLIPALSWNAGDLGVDVAAGVFAGRQWGELSQYRKNGYLKVSLDYVF